MSKLSSPKNAIVAGVLAVALVAGAFWVLAISPKREEVSKLESQVEQVKGSLAQHQAEIATAEQARRTSRPNTSASSCSARRCRAATKPPRCWCS